MLVLGETDASSWARFKAVAAKPEAFLERLRTLDPQQTTVSQEAHARIKAIVE
jgi:hypothetical protein